METCFLIPVIFEIKGPADFLSFESTIEINPYPRSNDIEELSDTSSISIFPWFSSFSSSTVSFFTSSESFDVYQAITPENNAPVKNKVFGIPGTRPNNNNTAETGTQALDKPICFEIWPDKSFSSDEILVTIVAVAIAKSNEGICATKPSPTVKSM